MSDREPGGRRKQITDAAARLFDKNGFHETSMSDLAQDVGVKKPTLYHHVSSKAQIVGWIHDECLAAIGPPLTEYLVAELPPTEILSRVATDIFTLLDSKPGYLRVFFNYHRDLDAETRSVVYAKRDEYLRNLEIVIVRGCEGGIFVADDTRLAALAFFGMCNWGHQWYQPNGRYTPKEVGLYMSTLFLNGLVARGVSAGVTAT